MNIKTTTEKKESKLKNFSFSTMMYSLFWMKWLLLECLKTF